MSNIDAKKQLFIARACGIKPDHDLVKQALEDDSWANIEPITITKEDLYKKASTGKSFFAYEEVWKNLDKLSEMCGTVTGTDLLMPCEDGKCPLEHATKLKSIPDNAFNPIFWQGNIREFEQAWFKFGEEKDNQEKYLAIRRQIAALDGETIREDEISIMDIGYLDIKNAIEKADYEELRAKFSAHGDHLRSEDILMLNKGNHMMHHGSIWENFDQLVEELANYGEIITVEQFTRETGTGNTLLHDLFKTGEVPEKVFNADFWQGRREDMMELFEAAKSESKITETNLNKLNINDVLMELVHNEFEGNLPMNDTPDITKSDLKKALHKPMQNDSGDSFVSTFLTLKRVWADMDTIRETLKANGEQITLEDLRETSGSYNETYIMYAARYGHFDKLLNILEDSNEFLSADDLFTKQKGKSVFDALCETGQVDLVLTPEFWVNHEAELCEFRDKVPHEKVKDVDIGRMRQEVALLTLRQKFNKDSASNDNPEHKPERRRPSGPAP